MTKPLPRRGLFALAGAAWASLPAFGRTAPSARPSGRSRSITIPRSNPIFSDSAKAFDTYGYSPAVRSDGLLFIAGVVGAKPDGTIAATVEEQAELAFVRTAEILRLHGLTMADIVDMTSYHVELEKTLPAFKPVKERHVPAPFPAWTIIGVEALASPSLKLEIRSIAALR